MGQRIFTIPRPKMRKGSRTTTLLFAALYSCTPPASYLASVSNISNGSACSKCYFSIPFNTFCQTFLDRSPYPIIRNSIYSQSSGTENMSNSPLLVAIVLSSQDPLESYSYFTVSVILSELQNLNQEVLRESHCVNFAENVICHSFTSSVSIIQSWRKKKHRIW